jgi:hypothetical protein
MTVNGATLLCSQRTAERVARPLRFHVNENPAALRASFPRPFESVRKTTAPFSSSVDDLSTSIAVELRGTTLDFPDFEFLMFTPST